MLRRGIKSKNFQLQIWLPAGSYSLFGFSLYWLDKFSPHQYGRFIKNINY
jgi:hypothetical protein